MSDIELVGGVPEPTALPEPLALRRTPGGPVDAIGTYADGQYLGQELDGFAVVHRFDAAGTHVGSVARADGDLDALIAELADAEPGDICIRTFWIEHEGVVCGLIDATYGAGAAARLVPGDVALYPPFDGAIWVPLSVYDEPGIDVREVATGEIKRLSGIEGYWARTVVDDPDGAKVWRQPVDELERVWAPPASDAS